MGECKESNFTDLKTKKMIEKIKQIIAENSEEKHFVEYGKGVFATDDAVDEMAESIVELFSLHNVSQQRELLLDYEIYNASEDDKKNNMKYLESLVDTYLSNNCG